MVVLLFVWLFLGCCERDVPRPVCHRLCSYDSLLSTFDDPVFFVCLAYIRNLVGCATSMWYLLLRSNFNRLHFYYNSCNSLLLLLRNICVIWVFKVTCKHLWFIGVSNIFVKVAFFLIAWSVFAVVDGDDRTQCCESKGVSGQCLGVCSGNITNFPANYIDCLSHVSSFASCYDIPLPTQLPPRMFSYCICHFVIYVSKPIFWFHLLQDLL